MLCCNQISVRFMLLMLLNVRTTSIWPGTTLSLLKFPVMRPTTYRLELRRRRLLQTRAWLKKEMYSRKLLLQNTKDPKYAVLVGTIQNTFKEKDEELQPVPVARILAEEEDRTSNRWSLQDELFKKGMWCYDTPGTINDEQVLSLFTLDELIHVLPRHLLQPRTALVPTGYSLLIGGVARIDVEECIKDGRLLLTTFASEDLPLNCMPTCEVDEFLKENLGTDALVVPRGKERLSQWPAMDSRVFELRGKKGGGAVADIVLSSIGWVSVTSSSSLIRIRSYTPYGKGLTTRAPMLPFAADLRGKRIPGTRFYKVKPVEFPVNVRRLKALKRRKLCDKPLMAPLKTKEVFERHLWLRPTAYLSTAIAVLIYVGFGVIPTICCFCSLFLGATTAAWIANSSDGRFLYPLICNWFSNEVKAPHRFTESAASFESSKLRSFPWKELLVPSSVNEALESLLDQLIDEYVNNWYESGISRDRDFLNEIRYQIRFVCSQL
ncbi:hypothetical protein KIN20_001225 [Parelaphostrongylus tenuis]|uniref:PXA domain-containing protein n=1 Tax=Parelaphostrongylus tenuis TaxID=148309 RepID=A0AAD5MCJ8_PARTN|nr:hypothetical protein KIN20_001225 [Parelaphostrongylus tenuis]